MVIVEGDRDAQRWLLTGQGRVDDWLYELTDEISFFAYGRIHEHAPGRIGGLVEIDPAHEPEIGSFEATAGVMPDLTEETFGRGLGSDPADFPVYVEVGTGVFGEHGTPIESIPGHVMGPFEFMGEMIFAREVKGQRGQHYVRAAFEDTVGWLPGRIETALLELGRRTE